MAYCYLDRVMSIRRTGAATLIATALATGGALLAPAPSAAIVASTKLENPEAFRENDRFGSSVAIDGNLAVVGAPFDDNTRGVDAGAAYVYQRSGTGFWSLEQKLRAPDGNTGDRFGSSVAVFQGSLPVDSRILVGAPFDDNSAGVDAGAAYVFERSSLGWAQTRRLNIGHLRGTNDRFGSSVAISRFDAVVGIPLDDTPDPGGLSGAGSATAFDRFQDWGVRGLLTAGSSAGNFELFGTSVAMAQGLPSAGRPVPFAVVGAPRDSTGEAYVFEANRFDPGGNPAVSPWRSVGRLPRSNPSRAFGTSVAADQGFIVVGAPEEPPNFLGEGAVHIFSRSFTPLGWSEERFDYGPPGATSFGQSVGVSAFGPGSAANALVGSPLATGRSPTTGMLQPRQGLAWVLNRSGSPPSWSAPTIIEANDRAPDDSFGSSVDVSISTAIIGAPTDDVATGFPPVVVEQADAGSAYVVSVP